MKVRVFPEELYRGPANRGVSCFSDGSIERPEGNGPPLSPKTIRNHITLLGGIFRYSVKRQWAVRNPVDAVDLRPASGADPDLRFLDLEELEAVLRVPDAAESTTAKVRRVRFHDLRHTYGTRMAAVGTPIRKLMPWMGHQNMQTTLIYADYAPDPMQGAALAARAFGGQDDPSGLSVAVAPSRDSDRGCVLCAMKDHGARWHTVT